MHQNLHNQSVLRICYKLLVPFDFQRDKNAVVLTEAGCDCCVTLHEIALPDLKIYELSVVLLTFYFPLNIFGGGWQESFPAANGNKRGKPSFCLQLLSWIQHETNTAPLSVCGSNCKFACVARPPKGLVYYISQYKFQFPPRVGMTPYSDHPCHNNATWGNPPGK